MKIFVTPKCNLDCVYCFKDKTLEGPPLEEILDKIKISEESVFFIGGDPSLRSDLVQILKYAKSRGLRVSLQNSGILLNENMLEYVDDVYFDFDSIDYGAWSLITRRGREEYEASLKGIMLAKQKGKEIYIDSLLTTMSYATLEQTKKFCDENIFTLRILENKSVPGFEFNDLIYLPLYSAMRKLGNCSNVMYVPASDERSESEKYYLMREGK